MRSKSYEDLYDYLKISIHALTRSATAIVQPKKTHEAISIHALTRSATFVFLDFLLILISFQSTHSQGVRRLLHVDFLAVNKFNPRTHKECDADTKAVWMTLDISIHALTRSATELVDQLDKDLKISIHALTRSATSYAIIII